MSNTSINDCRQRTHDLANPESPARCRHPFGEHESKIKALQIALAESRARAAQATQGARHSQGLHTGEEHHSPEKKFLAMLSHDLRTPLTPVLLSVSRMLDKEDLPPRIRSELEMIRRVVEIELSLIDDLVDLNRFSAGKVTLHLASVDLHSLCNHVAEMCRNGLDSKNHALELNLRAGRHWITADPVRIQQVLWNLLRNAIKFTPDHGRIRITTWNDPDGTIAVRVSDNGMGIDPGSLHRIFDPFEQGDVPECARSAGLGLGLAIAKRAMDLHQGTLEAHSEGKGRGSEFTLRLPSLPAAPEVIERNEPAREVPKHASIRILLVEDHKDTAVTMSRILEGDGHYVKTAGTAAAALRLASAEPFNLVISDIGLPDATGFELMKSLRDQHHLTGIALSGCLEEDIAEARASGFAARLAKPVNVRQLDATIQQVMSGADSSLLSG